MDAKKLNELYPFLMVKNRRAHCTSVFYADGQSVVLQPHQKTRIQTAGLGQLPSINDVQLLDPTLPDLQAAGVVPFDETTPLAPEQ